MSRLSLASPLQRFLRDFTEVEGVIAWARRWFHALRIKPLFSAATLISVALLPQAALGADRAAADSLNQAQSDTLSGLRNADRRLNAIFWRLSTSNAAYCAPVVPATGMVLHARSSYLGPWRAAAQQFFGFEGEIAVEAVDPGSPAEQAGVLPGDTLSAVDGQPLDGVAGVTGVADAYTRLASAGAGGNVTLALRRAGQPITLTVATVPSCTQRIELRQTSQQNARTDGEIIQINSAYLNMTMSDDMLASIIAHELGHYVLHHPDRLQAAGAYRGLKSLFGGNVRLIYRTEEEADRISPWLMVNAGYDPNAAVGFWKGFGDSILNAASHAQPSRRAAVIQAEVEAIKAAGPPPLKPPFIDTRDQPLR